MLGWQDSLFLKSPLLWFSVQSPWKHAPMPTAALPLPGAWLAPYVPVSALFLAVLRTLMGHKANICSLDFHPYGEFVASGSQDTNIKVRRCLCPLSPTGLAAGPGPGVRPEEWGSGRWGRASSLCGRVHSPRETWKRSPDVSAQNAQLPRAVCRFLSFWGAQNASLLVATYHPLTRAPGRGMVRPLQPQPPGRDPSSLCALLFSPQLWDIRRKGCVFRYRVRKAPFVSHSVSTTQAWRLG